MRVLLTGAAGFIGTAVAAALEAAGHDVVRVDALVPQAHASRTDTGTDPTSGGIACARCPRRCALAAGAGRR